MRTAIVEHATGKVLNIVVSDGDGVPEEGQVFIPLKPSSRVDTTWKYDFDENQFFIIEQPLEE